MENVDDNNIFSIVLLYKNMSLDNSKHKVIIKDKTMIQFLAYSLDSNDENVVEASLETLDILIQNRHNHADLRNTFGVMEAILATSLRVDLRSKVRCHAGRLHTALESSAYSSLPASPSHAPSKTLATDVYTFHVFGLNEERRGDLEECLVRIGGVVSVVVDVPHQRLLARVVQGGPQPDKLISAVISNTSMSPVLLVKNSNGQEVLEFNSVCDGNDHVEEIDLPDYLPEDESPVKEKALLSFDSFRSNASTWVRSASAFLQDAFYW